MTPLTPKNLWLALGLAATALVAGSLILTAWFDLHPCHLCIFQRLLFIKLAVLGLLAFFLSSIRQKLAGALTLLLSGVGLGVVTYQSCLQVQPACSISCVGGEPGLI